MRKEIIGNCELYLGDCLYVMSGIGRVDHCITDPPYEAEAHTLQRRLLGKRADDGKRKMVTDKALGFAAITDTLRSGLADYCGKDVLGWALVFCQAEAIGVWRDAFEEAGTKYKRACVWIKPDGTPQYSGDRPGMGYESIMVAWCGKSKSKWNGGGRHGVFVYNKGEGAGPHLHETQKPVALMKQLVHLFSNAGELIFDPFMGSGTTGVACAKMGRYFIGCEIDPEHFDTSCRRIENAYRQSDMFIS